jgi:ribosome-associated protein
MDIRKLQRAIVDGLEDVKAQQISVFNTEHLSSMFERVIIASGASSRQTKALASSVRTAVKDAGLQVLRTEGEENGEWIIVDCGAAVVHVMQQAIREYYNLEEIWGGTAVRMKMGGATTGLVKASEPVKPQRGKANWTAERDAGAQAARDGAEPAVPAKKTAAKKSVKTPFSVRAKAPAKTVAKAGTKAGVNAQLKAAKTTPKPAVKAAAKPAVKKAPPKPIKTLVTAPPKSAAKKTTTGKAPAKKTASRSAPRKGPVTKVASRQ